MSKRITPDQLQDALNDILENYSDDLQTNLNAATKQVAEAAAQSLKERARYAGIKGNKYVRSFRAKKLDSSRLGETYVVYSTQYRLTHLLEHGHAIVVHGKRTGKRTRAFHHWSHVEEDAIRQLEQAVIRKVRNGGQ